MKTARLKSLVILLLLLVNLFLLILLVSQRVQEQSAYRRAAAQLTALLEQNGIALDPDALPRSGPDVPQSVSRDFAAERRFAETLLGETQASEAGGVYRCENAAGSCVFRSSGSMELSGALPCEDPQALCEQLFSAFGYRRISEETENGSYTVRAVRVLGEMTVYNAELALTFSDGALCAAEGSFVPDTALHGETEEMSAVSALVAFLDYRNANGVVCTAISDVQAGCLLQSTSALPMSLVPVWRIETDIYSYYVDRLSGEVTRA